MGWARAARRCLAEVGQIRRGGGVAQLAFDFAAPDVAAESLSQRMAWEIELLGQPVSVHPLAALAEESPGKLPQRVLLRRLPEHPRQSVAVAGVRLPGWTGGPSFFLADEDSFVQVRAAESIKAPPPWKPMTVRGRWVSDEYGSQWFQAEEVRML